jgi:uncharacterized protein (TIGR03067 family)
MAQAYRMVAVAVMALIGCGATARDAADDLKAMEGTWDLTYLERDGAEVKVQPGTRAINAGDKFVIKRGAEVVAAGTMKLDPSKTPKASEATYTDGPDKGKTFKGIYQIDGDTVKFCRAGSPDQERPTGFKTKPGSGQFVAAYKRSKQ